MIVNVILVHILQPCTRNDIHHVSKYASNITGCVPYKLKIIMTIFIMTIFIITLATSTPADSSIQKQVGARNVKPVWEMLAKMEDSPRVREATSKAVQHPLKTHS